MSELKVVRLDETDVVKFGPDAVYQLILGDDEGTTPIRTGIQTSQPGYVAPVHSHPYMESLTVLEGEGEAWLEDDNDLVPLKPGVTLVLRPNVRHWFRTTGDLPLKTYGVPASPHRIVNAHEER